ncbi:hypothetical protein [Novipirellula artificiosorum]|uniref:Uncharacterized protein n=1 Tax=Novipirellula artificiosorum TaxID=2528016 RepID=A0A5C6DAD2_9BACT|nr:hypothetical protein [Novipirellula artificiosorum]TWU32196.1 hypothetical protein Poly41_56810 [Novipirellula artificiosorum]
MNISNSMASFSSQASSSNSRPQGPPPKNDEKLASALQSLGVDDSTAANVLEQVDEAISLLRSESSSGGTSRAAFKSVVDDVLEANGIDSGEVEEAIQASGVSGAGGVTGASSVSAAGRPSGPGGPSGAGRPNGPPPPRREEESETSAVESALISAGLEESSTDELISQMIETIQELTAEAGSDVSQDELRLALTSLFEENGVDFSEFEQSLGEQLGSAGSFLDRIA